MGRGVLRTHVDDHRLVVAPLDIDVAGVDVAALGQAQDGAHLLAQLIGRGGVSGEQLLGALGGLGQEVTLLLGLPVLLLGGLEAELGLGRLLLVVLVVVAHRGPGASLNCTGTRPTP